MTQYNFLNIKLSNSQLNQQKSRIKNATNVTLRLSNMVILMMILIFHISYH